MMTDTEAAALCSDLVIAALFAFIAFGLAAQLAAFTNYLRLVGANRRQRSLDNQFDRAFSALVATYHREQ